MKRSAEQNARDRYSRFLDHLAAEATKSESFVRQVAEDGTRRRAPATQRTRGHPTASVEIAARRQVPLRTAGSRSRLPRTTMIVDIILNLNVGTVAVSSDIERNRAWIVTSDNRVFYGE